MRAFSSGLAFGSGGQGGSADGAFGHSEPDPSIAALSVELGLRGTQGHEQGCEVLGAGANFPAGAFCSREIPRRIGRLRWS
jgi:hypothetical protein